MRICDRCGAKGIINKIEILINQKHRKNVELCDSCVEDMLDNLKYNDLAGHSKGILNRVLGY